MAPAPAQRRKQRTCRPPSPTQRRGRRTWRGGTWCPARPATCSAAPRPRVRAAASPPGRRARRRSYIQAPCKGARRPPAGRACGVRYGARALRTQPGRPTNQLCDPGVTYATHHSNTGGLRFRREGPRVPDGGRSSGRARCTTCESGRRQVPRQEMSRGATPHPHPPA